ncbi:Desert hedgehog protein A [Folsomia candida]|uniref:Desert hedgehog protein A n=1 Tax=Folsomia candida TaxID=158441 RepID=A0A226F227_FOLCA|nr:Desert hedgehog protein A [Folsomia candida]
MAVPCCCFPGSTIVTTNHGVRRLDQLVSGDKVLTSSDKKGQGLKWTKLYTWAHREADRVAEFVILKMSNGKEVQITADHLLFVAGKKGRVAKKAADKLYHMNTSGSLELLDVVEISLEAFTGVYAPLTMTGHFIANGFLVACYSNISDFEVAHVSMAPLRTWYKLFESGQEVEKEGIHGYAKNLMKVRDLLPQSVQISVN